MVKAGLGREANLPREGPRLKRPHMANASPRPLAPHLTIWRWGPHMAVSILHRATGVALTFAGLGLLTWWLYAISTGPDAYETFTTAAKHPLGIAVLVGLPWSLFQDL